VIRKSRQKFVWKNSWVGWIRAELSHQRWVENSTRVCYWFKCECPVYLLLMYTCISFVIATDLYAHITCIYYWFVRAYRVYFLLIYTRTSCVFSTDLYAHIACIFYWFMRAYHVYFVIMYTRKSCVFLKWLFRGYRREVAGQNARDVVGKSENNPKNIKEQTVIG